MNIDKRYLELLARVMPGKQNKWLKRLAMLGFMFGIIGAYMLINGYNLGTKHGLNEIMLLGITIAAAGMIITGLAIVLKDKESKRNIASFMEYCEKNGKLPPWPEKPGSQQEKPDEKKL